MLRSLIFAFTASHALSASVTGQTVELALLDDAALAGAPGRAAADHTVAMALLPDDGGLFAGSPFRESTFVTARLLYWTPSLTGDMNLEDDLGFSTDLDFEDDLDVDDAEEDLAWEVSLHFGPSFVRISGYSIESSALETASQTISFGDVTIDTGDLFDADLAIDDIKIQSGWSIFNLEDHGFTLALTFGVDIFQIDASIEDVTTLLSDSIDEDLPLPIIGGHIDLPLGSFLVSADVSGFSLEVEDVDFAYLDASVSLTWMPIDHVGVHAGFRLIDFDLDSDDFDLDSTLSGPFFGLEIRF